MKNAIYVHGRPSRREDFSIKSLGLRQSSLHWASWLGEQLKKRGYEFNAPEMPRAYDPNYEAWQEKFERFKTSPDTVLVGHSCGGGFLIKYLSLHPQKSVGKVILVAPWLGYDYGAPPTDFFEGYKIDPNIAKRTKGLIIFYSDNDFNAIKKSVSKLKSTLENAKYKEFRGYGHFTLTDMRTRKFPELLEECLKTSVK